MAIATALCEEDRDWDQYRREQLVLFSDASRAKKRGHSKNRGGYAVAWRRPGRRHLENCFRVRATELTCITNIMHGEMLGLCEALCIAYEYALGGRLFKGTVKVFSDSMESLNILGMLRNTEELERVVSDPIVKPIVEAIIWLSHRLRECRIHTDLHWIPGHGHNVYPHQLVDRTSRDVWTGEWQRTVDSYLPMRWGLRGETWEYEEADWSEEVGRLMYSMRAYLMRKNTRDGATYNRKEERSKEDLSDVEEGQVVEVQRIA